MAASVVLQVTGLVSQALGTTAKLTHIGELPSLVARIPIVAILLGHTLAVAGLTKGSWPNALLGYIQGFLLAFGGGILSNAFLGNPTANVIFQSNQYVLIWTAAWWLVNHNPIDIVGRALNSAPIGIFARASVQVLRAAAVVAQVDAAVKAFPGIVVPAIAAGALAGAGGKITTEIINSIVGLRSTSELSSPTYLLRSALVGSSIYYITVYVLGALSAAEGYGVVLLAFLAHTLSDDIIGTTYDYTTPVINVFNTVTLVSGVRGRSRSRGRATAPAAAAASPAPRSGSKARTPSRRRR